MPSAQLLVIAGCICAGLALTLVLASFLTPRAWWRRANVRALAVLVLGTAVFGGLFLLSAGEWPHHPAPVALAVPLPAPAPLLPVRAYRVVDDLNLRSASGTGAARIVVVPGGTTVTTTGRVQGDWWEVTARVNGRPVTGWASSLWLRRGDEVKPGT